MICSEKEQLDPSYELSIEPITFSSIMGRYSHTLKVRYEGVAIDPGRILYLSLAKELGVTDLTRQLMWYRNGATYCHINGVLVRTSTAFPVWVLQMTQQFRSFLSQQPMK